MEYIPVEILSDVFISVGTDANHQFPTEIYTKTDIFNEAMKNIRLVSQKWNTIILNSITKLPKKKLNECSAQLLSNEDRLYIRITPGGRDDIIHLDFPPAQLINCYFGYDLMIYV